MYNSSIRPLIYERINNRVSRLRTVSLRNKEEVKGPVGRVLARETDGSELAARAVGSGGQGEETATTCFPASVFLSLSHGFRQ